MSHERFIYPRLIELVLDPTRITLGQLESPLLDERDQSPSQGIQVAKLMEVDFLSRHLQQRKPTA
ncbi:hypothetical protein [Aliiroseovarius subalbicans]|uniref:hypothetical protein n=1 Tax=Aliiroseovarius subalbicans TaxID=2925840 RepID=UPI001F59B985|nr:hypothetical protein [Aliiroseovarius subalbicans]MCI2399939.1 hypothetical protein [Aliiroseovarius subalbicans]